eukprot:GILK01002147.1.p2 GENE.GILK01002147.1~~GILK01002147.1.p2  ORF type:complete len:279 (-),score=49.29 GILK01002147.1:2189-2974(-)
MDAESAFGAANAFFVDENFDEAITHYTLAIQLDDKKDIFFVNRAAANIKIGNYTDALADANSALSLDNNNSRAFYRKGCALFYMDEFESAKTAFERALQLRPSSTEVQMWIRKCVVEIDGTASAVGGQAAAPAVPVAPPATAKPTPTIAPTPVVPSAHEVAAAAPEQVKTYPSSSKKAKDWSKLEKELDADADKPEGEEALNKLFREIYSNADEDTRRAMIKSFQTSGGTVLSTNWNEVQTKNYEKERTAPDGQEWKKWDS